MTGPTALEIEIRDRDLGRSRALEIRISELLESCSLCPTGTGGGSAVITLRRCRPGGESARRDDVDDAFALENLKQFTDRVLRPDVGRVRFCGEFLHTARRSSSHFVIE